jgi:hypothetical protein
MAKLRLNLSDLKVDSFLTAPQLDSRPGTVQGQTAYETNCDTHCNDNCANYTYYGCQADNSAESYGSCGTTCGVDETCSGYEGSYCGAGSVQETICVTGCEPCPC